MNFLRYDSPFTESVCRLVDYVCLGILWIVTSIPVITFGAATTAALQTAETAIRKEEGKIFINFRKSFRKEFKQATLIWLIQLPILAVLVIDLLMITNSEIFGVLRLIVCIATSIIFCWVQLWFGYLSKFEDTIKTILGNTFRIMMISFGQTFFISVLTLLALLATVVSFLLTSPLLLLIPGLFLNGYSSLSRKLFAKYLPSEALPSARMCE